MDLTPGPEVYEAAEDNCRQWVRMVTGNPQMDISPLNRERARALVDLVWPLAYRAGREDEAAALARGQQQREEPWQIRAAATGGGPCPTCRKPFWTHVCLSCSPDYQTPGEGCVNCRNSGMDQTPCKPAVDSIASQHTQDGVR